jgi:streptogramin lyase
VQVFPSPGHVLVVGVKTSGGVLTQRNALGRIDAGHDRVEGVTPLPSGPLAAASGQGQLWVARVGGSTIERIDPLTGAIIGRARGKVGAALAVAGGHLWTAYRDGVVRELR